MCSLGTVRQLASVLLSLGMSSKDGGGLRVQIVIWEYWSKSLANSLGLRVFVHQNLGLRSPRKGLSLLARIWASHWCIGSSHSQSSANSSSSFTCPSLFAHLSIPFGRILPCHIPHSPYSSSSSSRFTSPCQLPATSHRTKRSFLLIAEINKPAILSGIMSKKHTVDIQATSSAVTNMAWHYPWCPRNIRWSTWIGAGSSLRWRGRIYRKIYVFIHMSTPL